MSKFTDFFKTVKNMAAAAGGFLKEKTAPVSPHDASTVRKKKGIPKDAFLL